MAFTQVVAGSGDNKRDVYGATDVSICTIAFGAGDTYVAGGLALAAAQFGLSRPILGVVVIGSNTAGIVIEWRWNTQTQKLMAMFANVGAINIPVQDIEDPNATVLTGMVLTVLVITQR